MEQLERLIKSINEYYDSLNLDTCPSGGVGSMLPIGSECRQSETIDDKAEEISNLLKDLIEFIEGKKMEWEEI